MLNYDHIFDLLNVGNNSINLNKSIYAKLETTQLLVIKMHRQFLNCDLKESKEVQLI